MRSCLCDASSRRKLVYKDACDLLVPMLQIISRPWRQADSKLANLSYSALASDICSIVVETIDMDVPEPAFANTLKEFEVAYKEAESMLDWDQAMRDVESDNNNSLQLLSVIPNNKKHDIHIAEMRLIQDFNSQLISSSSDNMSDDEMLFGTDLNSEALPLLHSFDLSTAFPIENLLSPESIVSTSELNMFNFCEHRSDISAESSVECNNNTKVEQNRDKKSNIVMVASDPVGNLKWVTERASDNSFKNAIESLLAISIGDLQKELQQQLSDGAEKITSQQLRTEIISFSVR